MVRIVVLPFLIVSVLVYEASCTVTDDFAGDGAPRSVLKAILEKSKLNAII